MTNELKSKLELFNNKSNNSTMPRNSQIKLTNSINLKKKEEPIKKEKTIIKEEPRKSFIDKENFLKNLNKNEDFKQKGRRNER